MCRRYQLTVDKDLVARYFNAQLEFDFTERYNIATAQTVPVVLQIEADRVITGMQWGLIPYWEKDEKKAMKPVNARAETVATNGLFRSAFQRHRCLVPATGFYEWQHIDNLKLPFLINLKDRELYAMPGIYDNWKDPTGVWRQTFAVITVEPNSLVRNVHDRMPVILGQGAEDAWLDPDTTSVDLQALLHAYPESEMQAFRVSSKVNSVLNEGPDVAATVNDSATPFR